MLLLVSVLWFVLGFTLVDVCIIFYAENKKQNGWIGKLNSC